MRYKILAWQISLGCIILIFSSYACSTFKQEASSRTTETMTPSHPTTQVPPTSIHTNTAQSSSARPSPSFTKFTQVPTPILFPTSTSITLSRPTPTQLLHLGLLPHLPINFPGIDSPKRIDYISISNDVTFLWTAWCVGQDAQSLQTNVDNLNIQFLVNDHIVDESSIASVDEEWPEPYRLYRTWGILVSELPAHTTTKFEVRTSLIQNGFDNYYGEFFSILYVNKQ